MRRGGDGFFTWMDGMNGIFGVMCNGIATSLDKLGMILRRAQDERVALTRSADGELVEPSATVLRQAQDERVVNFHNFEMALREPRSRFTKYER